MLKFCPLCEKESIIEKISTTEKIIVRGESFDVPTEFYRCDICNSEFEDGNSSVDSGEIAFNEYRKKHGMLYPQEIKKFRKKFGLTQHELAQLLGFGGATLSRYENGSLQEETHDNLLRFTIEPQNLLRLIKKNPEVFNERKRSLLIKQLEKPEEWEYSLQTVFDTLIAEKTSTVYNGFRPTDIEKIKNLILYFCREDGGVFKTIINKLLFYVDFKNFKENGISLTGSLYIRNHYGPVPKGYEMIFSIMYTCDGTLESKEIIFNIDCIGEKYYATSEPNLSVFKPHEFEVMEFVKNKFKGFSAREVSDYSHNESAWKNTAEKQPISYEFASKLQI